ncbi:unnamed protein product [Urochloa humidicola]
MEPNNQSDDTDLEAYHQEIAERVGAPSSPPPLNPQQELAAPDMLEPQPEAPSYGGVEHSPGDRIRDSTRVWLFNNAPDAPDTSAARTGSELSASAEEYHPIAPSQSHPSVLQSSSTPSFSASQGQTSASARRSLTQEEDRVRCLVPADVGSAGSSACVVRLLKEGLEVVREGVLDRVKGALHFFMASPEWHDVFVELLREGSFDELRVIVDVACKSDVRLISVANNECGVKSIMDLFSAVKPYSQLGQELIICLMDDCLCPVEGHVKAPAPYLLRGIFATFPYENTSVVIKRALDNFSGVLSSKYGSESMVECFAAAEKAELQKFEALILSHIVPFATGKHSNYFVQEVLERGEDALKERITDLVLQHRLPFSIHQYGCYVVQACFTKTGSARLTLLHRVLRAFGDLSHRELTRLVRNHYAAYVVRELLLASKAHFLDETVALAQRIRTLPVPPAAQYPDQAVGAMNVMQAVSKVLP